MSQPLPFDEINFETNVCLKQLLNIQDDSDFDYFLEVNLRYPRNSRQKNRFFLLPRINLYLKMILMII